MAQHPKLSVKPDALSVVRCRDYHGHYYIEGAPFRISFWTYATDIDADEAQRRLGFANELVAAWNTRQAAEAEAKSREAWRPIETAPKEVEGALYAAPRLLLLVPPYGAFTGCWGRNPEYPWGGDWSIPGLLNKEARPTHWMPLPEPPEPQP